MNEIREPSCINPQADRGAIDDTPESGPPLAGRAPKRLIVTADDFGLAVAVNEAVEIAHEHGILTTASLMMSAPATADAIQRARRLPRLNVGLHLVLTDGAPTLPPDDIAGLVSCDGMFDDRLVRHGARIMFSPTRRRQVHREIHAQFEAFKQTGLRLDHVNAHKHFHLHPAVLDSIIAIGRQYGLKAVRAPYEPLRTCLAISRRRWAAKVGWALVSTPCMAILRRKLRRAGLISNGASFGLSDSGRMNEATLMGILKHLPDGDNEIYFHPATAPLHGLARQLNHHGHREELEALLSLKVRRHLRHAGIETIGFPDIE